MFKILTQEIADAIKSLPKTEIKADGKKTYKMVISKEIEDRGWDIVRLSGIELENYMLNPVVLQDHSYKVENIIWKTLSIKQEGNELIAEFVFADTEKAQLAEKLYNGGFLKGSSIGFIKKWIEPTNPNIITIFELVEWSLVAIPCNPRALSMDKKDIEDALSFGLIIEEKQEENKSEISEIKQELAEIKQILKSLVDSKTQENTKEAEELEILRKKELLQAIARGTNQALEAIKKL